MKNAPMTGAGGTGSAENSLSQRSRAAQINEAHCAGNAAALDALKHSRRALEHYYRAGVLLNEQKAELPHGGWLPWLEANFEGDPRTAQRYMRLADNWPAIQANYDTVSHLSLSKALLSLTEPKEEPKQPTGYRALRERVLPAIDAAKFFAKVRDEELYRYQNYATFEDYCAGRFGLDADGIRAVLEIGQPDTIPLRDAAIAAMCEHDLTFEGALAYITKDFQEHLKGAE